MMAWVCGLVAFAGFAAIALSMERHRGDLMPGGNSMALRRTVLRRSARTLGYAVLALAALPATTTWGVSVGLTVWLGVLTPAAAALALLLSYRPGVARALACAALPVGLLAWAVMGAG